MNDQVEFVDKEITCKQCGKKFIFSADGQKFFKKMEYVDPVRCKSCREKRNTKSR